MVVNLFKNSIPILPQFTRMSSSLQYYLIPLVLFFGVVYPDTVMALELVCFFYGVLPLLDGIFTLDTQNPNKQETKALEDNNLYFEVCLYLTVLVDWACFLKIMGILSSDQIRTISWLDIISLLIMYGSIGAMSILVSHQLYHKLDLTKKIIGLVSMCNTFYIHWTVEHIIGHHKNVATPLDPATSQKGQTFYKFYPKAVIGTWKSCFQIERSKGRSIFSNLAVISIVVNVVMCLAVQRIYGLQGLIFFVLGGMQSFTILELINYLEHYGLERKKLANGEYQKVDIRHSWNTPHRFTNYFMFKLQRHSDHHENSLKPYQTLLTLETSPQLPQGYTMMLIIALFPKAFFQIMDPILEYYKQKYQGKQPDQAMRQRSQQISNRFMIKTSAVLGGLLLLRHSVLG